MHIVPCPSCGAEVRFRSHAAVMAVCEFCRAAILKDEDSVKHFGTMSDVLEDFSPIQIGTAGVAGTRGFTVIGRIQLRYAHGMWNEWFVLFGDGATGWLGDSSGLYAMTTERQVEGALPLFDAIEPGHPYAIGGESFTASEKRQAECVGGQGELPFRVGDGWRICVADLRRGENFITLDYTDGEAPLVYSGSSLTLEAMKCQLLRDDEQIKASAGRYRGKLDALDCPSCGSMIAYMPGVTSNLICPACATQLDAAGPEAKVLAIGQQAQRIKTTIEIGAKARIDQREYTVLGAMVRADEEGTEWTEYLLFNPVGGFFWLVETAEGWSRATVLSKWPQCDSLSGQSAKLDSADYEKTVDYRARVQFAAGAFNWRVAVGDTVSVHEFEHGQSTLAAEISADELTWSRSSSLAYDQVEQWFPALASKIASTQSKSVDTMSSKYIWWLVGLNVVPLMLNFRLTFVFLFIGIVAICVAPGFVGPEREDK